MHGMQTRHAERRLKMLRELLARLQNKRADKKIDKMFNRIYRQIDNDLNKYKDCKKCLKFGRKCDV